MAAPLREIPLDDAHWDWGGAEPVVGEHVGRSCVAFGDTFGLATARGIDLAEGSIELDLAVGRDRAFHGVVWHVADDANDESFFLRPHQVGNPDAVSTRRSGTTSREHRLVGRALPPARAGSQRARLRGLRGLRWLGPDRTARLTLEIRPVLDSTIGRKR